MVGSLTLALAGVTACNRADDTSANSTDMATASTPAAPENGRDLTVTGCLTAGLDGRSFALTPSDTRPTEAGQALQMPGRDTITYELVGKATDFEGRANTIVTATGREDASVARDAGVERKDETTQPAAAGSSDTPTVETKEEVQVNVRRLHVTNVLATGQACPSVGTGGGPAMEPPAPTRPGAQR